MRYSFLCYTPEGSSEAALPPATVAKHEEHQYLDLVAELIKEGVLRCVLLPETWSINRFVSLVICVLLSTYGIHAQRAAWCSGLVTVVQLCSQAVMQALRILLVKSAQSHKMVGKRAGGCRSALGHPHTTAASCHCRCLALRTRCVPPHGLGCNV